MYSVLLVDDDESAVSSLARALGSSLEGVALHVATTSETALQIAAKHSPQVAVLDLCLDPEQGVESGFALLKSLHREYPSMRLLVLTGHGDSSFGIRAIQLGAANFLVKPADIPHLSALVLEGMRQSELLSQAVEQQQRDADRVLDEAVVGSSRVAKELKEQIRFVASTSQPVLLEGETGVGKSLCARLIHDLSKRSEAPFVRYQPGLTRSDILASELFGHEKGSFTGAESARDGLLLHAHTGTFFLDEIDGLPAETQTGLLGVLQEKKFRKVGADNETAVDIRFLSATNADVEQLVDTGSLRSDFFHRIAHGRVVIPPLRDRVEDIPELVQRIIQKLQREEEIGFLEVSDEVLDALSSHSWPGNVRELEGVVEGAAARAQFAGRHIILPEDAGKVGADASKTGEVDESLQQQVVAFKKAKVEEALSRTENNQVKAAKSLGIDRTTLRRILQS